jgi:uncharacterized membrane protein YeaQ/YmgE (transglycosylase-associated protein family)
MGVLSWIVLGLIAGVLAKWIMPGKDPGGLIVTILIGIGGAFVGGFLGSFMGHSGVNDLSIASIVTAMAGALVLLFLYRLIRK